MSDADDPPSPCNSICSIDDITGFCAGCLRTLDEIAAWGQLAAREKQALLDQLAMRRMRHGSDVLERWERTVDEER
jgi:predicted Fe-S protein YdhL (DUF1289 family)